MRPPRCRASYTPRPISPMPPRPSRRVSAAVVAADIANFHPSIQAPLDAARRSARPCATVALRLRGQGVAELAVSSAETLQQHSPQAAIARASTAVTAFIGRALKGPVNQPTVLHSFDEYQRLFGGLWQPSTLSYAVEQYFEHGGRECIVVRVCNGGRAPTLRLPSAAGASAPALTLVGRRPGTREFLRAAVDYDGIVAAEPDRFNLVVQRSAHRRLRDHRGAGDLPSHLDPRRCRAQPHRCARQLATGARTRGAAAGPTAALAVAICAGSGLRLLERRRR